MSAKKRAGIIAALLLPVASPAAHAGAVMLWNDTLLSIAQQTSGLLTNGPPEIAREIAMVDTAMYDAVNAATGQTYKPYAYAPGPMNASADCRCVAGRLHGHAEHLFEPGVGRPGVGCYPAADHPGVHGRSRQSATGDRHHSGPLHRRRCGQHDGGAARKRRCHGGHPEWSEHVHTTGLGQRSRCLHTSRQPTGNVPDLGQRDALHHDLVEPVSGPSGPRHHERGVCGLDPGDRMPRPSRTHCRGRFRLLAPQLGVATISVCSLLGRSAPAPGRLPRTHKWRCSGMTLAAEHRPHLGTGCRLPTKCCSSRA